MGSKQKACSKYGMGFFYFLGNYKNFFVGPILGILGTSAHFRHFLFWGLQWQCFPWVA